MLNDYKGEKPNNVISEEEHRKRPFYKKVSFWVLSALGLFFGGCSVYGLVLGYQYVSAVTEAAHIIAHANSDEAKSKEDTALSRMRQNALDENTIVKAVDLGTLSYTTPNENGWTRSIDPLPYAIAPENNSTYPNVVCDAFITSTPNGVWTTGGTIGLDTNGSVIIRDNSFLGLSRTELISVLSGHYIYYKATQGISAQEGFYNEGYVHGYDDGSDAINLPQSVKILLPVGTQYSVQYKTYLDGVVDRQGQMNSSQTGGAYATFDRSRTQKLRIDLNVPSGSRAFFLYSPSWTSAYPTDENYPLRQSWAVSGVTYLPTWVAKPQIYVDFTSADVPDLTYETVSVAFDVDHWGDIKLGVYSQGYNDGYQAGQDDPTAYDSGYDAGYEQGYDDGHTLGVAQGEAQAVSGQKALVNMFVTAFQQPFDQIYRFLNFNVLGLNILALFTALLTLSIGIIIIKKVI